MTRLFVSQASPECPPKAANGYLLWWMCELTSLSKLGGLVTICCPLFYTTKVLYYSYNTIIISIIIFIKASS